MVCHLCCGITIVLYDGNPLAPSRTIMFDLVDEYQSVHSKPWSSLLMISNVTSVTCFSLSPRYLQILVQNGLKPKETHSLASLKVICTTGSPMKADLYTYVRDNIHPVFISNSSGRINGFTLRPLTDAQ